MLLTKSVVATLAGALTLVTAPAVSVAQDTDPVPALRQSARPLDDLRSFGRMVGDARVVGVGEATHSSHEFFATKARLFRYLVEHKGFRSFSLEIFWSSGLRLNSYVLNGTGDPARILRENFYLWNTQEYLDLAHWMRSYNLTHRNKVQFTGNDIGYSGPEVFNPVIRYAAQHRPDPLPTYEKLLADLDPRITDVQQWMHTYLARPLAERKAIAALAHDGYTRLAARRAPAWTLQHARVIDQGATLFAFDLSDPEHEAPKAMLLRDRAMADNTAWWSEHTASKVLLSAHNGHVAKVSDNPVYYPKVQGEFLRDRFGSRYVSVGFTFGQGSFNAYDDATGWHEYTVGPNVASSNEHTLDQVRRDDYLLDIRTSPASAWLDQARRTRSIGLGYPQDDFQIALRRSFDVVIHLHRITAAHLLVS